MRLIRAAKRVAARSIPYRCGNRLKIPLARCPAPLDNAARDFQNARMHRGVGAHAEIHLRRSPQKGLNLRVTGICSRF